MNISIPRIAKARIIATTTSMTMMISIVMPSSKEEGSGGGNCVKDLMRKSSEMVNNPKFESTMIWYVMGEGWT